MLNDLALSVEGVRSEFANMLETVADRPDDGKLINAIARAILVELSPIADRVAGSDFGATLRSLGGPKSVSDLAAHYPDLAGPDE